jgi:hypothetical protein
MVRGFVALRWNGSFAPSELPLFTTDTQGSAKPPPWAESCNRFAVKNTQFFSNHLSHRSRSLPALPALSALPAFPVLSALPALPALLSSRYSLKNEPLQIFSFRQMGQDRMVQRLAKRFHDP